jgi:hypothetical protein
MRRRNISIITGAAVLALQAAFLIALHFILHNPGPPMTFANGARGVTATCEACGPEADVNGDDDDLSEGTE